MKKYIFLFFALVCLTANAQKNTSLDQIEVRWTSKSIKVNGANPNILTLVKAFQQSWPTYSGGELIKFANSKKPYDNTDKVVDLKNGYVAYAEDNPDSDSDEGMAACVWNRQNGHRLLAVTFYRMTPIERVVLCFYDYDPKTQMLVPEKNMVDLFKPSFPGYRYRVWLPQKGKELKVQEFFGAIVITHTYAWNGMRPANPKVTIDNLETCQAEFDNQFATYGNQFLTQYAMQDIDGDGKPELWMRNEDGSYQAVFSVAQTLDLIGGQDDRRELSFYKNAVCHSGTCGALCMSSVYVILKNSCRDYGLIEQSEWDNQLEDYGDNTYMLNGQEISSSQGQKIVNSLGEKREFHPQWRKLATE